MSKNTRVYGRVYYTIDGSQEEWINLLQGWFIFRCLAYVKELNDKNNLDLCSENEYNLYDNLIRYIIKDYEFDGYNDTIEPSEKLVKLLEKHFKYFKKQIDNAIKNKDFSFWNFKIIK